MTPDSAASWLPETIRRVGSLELRARHIVEGFLAGMHRSPYFGRSLEFRQHRQYTRGDDLRHVDWKVWARQDRLYVKQFEEDTNLRATLLVDQSASMSYGNGPLSKHELAATAAASLAYLLLRQNDAVGCVAFDSGLRGQTPQRSSRGHLTAIADLLRVPPGGARTDLGAALSSAAQAVPRRGLTILLSDLLADTAGLAAGLGELRRRGHDLIVLQVLDPDELEFPFEGPTRFEGLESDEGLDCDPHALRRDYLAALEAFLARCRQAARQHGADYALLRADRPLDVALTAVLAARLRRRRSGV